MLGLFLFTGPAPAANQTVTSLADSGAGSLRQAIALVGIGETITFAVTGTIELTGRLLISDNLTISGPGADVLRVRGNGLNFYIFDITNATVNISGLTVGGYPSQPVTYPYGGIHNRCGTLTVTGCSIQDSVPNGGIFNEAVGGCLASLIVQDCTLSRNEGFRGGGIHNYAANGSRAEVTVQNSTLYDNYVAANPSGFNVGGGILNSATGSGIVTLTVRNTTFVDNSAVAGDSIYNSEGGEVHVSNSLFINGSSSGNFENFGTFTSLGYNLSDDDGQGLLGSLGDQTLTDPLLDPAGLRNNGGRTKTIALQAGSPAVDKGNSPLSTDQRGFVRPIDFPNNTNAIGGNASDIGAFERQDPAQSGPAFLVNTTADHDDGTFGEIDCTLREAIRAANLSTGVATIAFAANVTGTIILQSALGQLDVTAPVTLAGPGARKLALSGANGARPILFFAIGSSGSAVSGLTLRDAQRLGASVNGAGLANLGTLTVADCAFVNNIARALSGSQPGQKGGEARGGAIFNGGTLMLHRCTFSGNRAFGGNSRGSSTQFAFGPAGGGGLGAAVFNDTSATLTADNCTFWSNYGQGGDGANNTGAGSRGGNGGRGFGTVFNQGTMTLTSCTLALNLGIGGAGGFNDGGPGSDGGGPATSGGTCTVRNTISVYNTATSGPDAFGAFTSQGWNLLGKSNGSTGFTATGDQTGSSAAPLDARLGLFQNNGGPTDTFLLLVGSPAIDKGQRFGLETDQRNLPRLYDAPGTLNASGGDGTDIGAVEMQPNYSGPLKVLSLTLVGPTARVMIQGTNFLNYQLQKTDSLGTPVADLGAAQTADSIGQTEFTDFGPLPARRFYRARQAP